MKAVRSSTSGEQRAQRGHSLGAQILIMVLGCGAAHYFIARPLHERSERLDAEVALLLASGAGVSERATADAHEAEPARAGITLVRHEAAEVRARGACVEDTTKLFEVLYRLAEKHRVRVDELEPRTPSEQPMRIMQVPAPSTEGEGSDWGGEAPTTRGAADTMLHVGLTLTGDYADIEEFLRAYSELPAFTSIRSMRLTPTIDVQHRTVVVSLLAEHHAFDVSALQCAVEAAAHAAGVPSGIASGAPPAAEEGNDAQP